MAKKCTAEHLTTSHYLFYYTLVTYFLEILENFLVNSSFNTKLL